MPSEHNRPAVAPFVLIQDADERVVARADRGWPEPAWIFTYEFKDTSEEDALGNAPWKRGTETETTAFHFACMAYMRSTPKGVALLQDARNANKDKGGE